MTGHTLPAGGRRSNTRAIDRAPLEMPGGKKLAVVVAVNVEHYAWGRPALSLAPFTAELVPDPLNYSWRDYGAHVGIFRLMDIFDATAWLSRRQSTATSALSTPPSSRQAVEGVGAGSRTA